MNLNLVIILVFILSGLLSGLLTFISWYHFKRYGVHGDTMSKIITKTYIIGTVVLTLLIAITTWLVIR